MKRILILLSIISFTATFSQKKNFSLEIGYPLELSDGNPTGLSGVINSKIKYRFWDAESFRIGTSYSIDLLTGDLIFQNEKESFISHHFNLFGEVPLNSTKKLLSSLGVGYSVHSYFITTNIYSESGPVISETEKSNVGGFNINFGGTYDIFKNFFVQGNFQFIRLYVESFIIEEKNGFNTNRLKFGVGYRF
ncbi:hypothetical protein DKG77_05620 [Flagellimonas aquimarina]|uniref:Outer membrane protein beta-barrel domain-containing protein n=1 Tax=Flagellimonas aquimarina TaxID=2201895 RepID=A0A316LJK0_9FLAO|nr:outer membrane beta-barrel protein [Allomuricauda koreensis]PWL40300.1 hypothetical protein DKG77_05620 [Allomuricauda koreensis]